MSVSLFTETKWRVMLTLIPEFQVLFSMSCRLSFKQCIITWNKYNLMQHMKSRGQAIKGFGKTFFFEFQGVLALKHTE